MNKGIQRDGRGLFCAYTFHLNPQGQAPINDYLAIYLSIVFSPVTFYAGRVKKGVCTPY